jgi:hypothetical protein
MFKTAPARGFISYSLRLDIDFWNVSRHFSRQQGSLLNIYLLYLNNNVKVYFNQVNFSSGVGTALLEFILGVSVNK